MRWWWCVHAWEVELTPQLTATHNGREGSDEMRDDLMPREGNQKDMDRCRCQAGITPLRGPLTPISLRHMLRKGCESGIVAVAMGVLGESAFLMMHLEARRDEIRMRSSMGIVMGWGCQCGSGCRCRCKTCVTVTLLDAPCSVLFAPCGPTTLPLAIPVVVLWLLLAPLVALAVAATPSGCNLQRRGRVDMGESPDSCLTDDCQRDSLGGGPSSIACGRNIHLSSNKWFIISAARPGGGHTDRSLACLLAGTVGRNSPGRRAAFRNHHATGASFAPGPHPPLVLPSSQRLLPDSSSPSPHLSSLTPLHPVIDVQCPNCRVRSRGTTFDMGEKGPSSCTPKACRCECCNATARPNPAPPPRRHDQFLSLPRDGKGINPDLRQTTDARHPRSIAPIAIMGKW